MITEKNEQKKEEKIKGYSYTYLFKKKIDKIIKADALQLVSQRILFNVLAKVVLPDSRRVRIFPIVKIVRIVQLSNHTRRNRPTTV